MQYHIPFTRTLQINKKNKMSHNDQETPENEEQLPNKCPVCDQVVKKLVLHISRNKSCSSNIDPELYKQDQQV